MEEGKYTIKEEVKVMMEKEGIGSDEGELLDKRGKEIGV